MDTVAEFIQSILGAKVAARKGEIYLWIYLAVGAIVFVGALQARRYIKRREEIKTFGISKLQQKKMLVATAVATAEDGAVVTIDAKVTMEPGGEYLLTLASAKNGEVKTATKRLKSWEALGVFLSENSILRITDLNEV